MQIQKRIQGFFLRWRHHSSRQAIQLRVCRLITIIILLAPLISLADVPYSGTATRGSIATVATFAYPSAQLNLNGCTGVYSLSLPPRGYYGSATGLQIVKFEVIGPSGTTTVFNDYVFMSYDAKVNVTATACSCDLPEIWDEITQTCKCDLTVNDLFIGNCIPKCDPSTYIRTPGTGTCVPPCSEGQVKIWDPERCECIDPALVLVDGNCVPPETCEDKLQEAILFCHGQEYIDTFNCESDSLGNLVSSYTCKPPPVCPGESVWSWETGKCEPIQCTAPQVWNPVLSKCEDPHICNPPKIWDFELEKCDYPEPVICAPDEMRDAYGNCFKPMPEPDPENPDPEQPDPGTCPDNTTMDENGDCRQDQPPNPDDPPGTDPDPNDDPVVKEDPEKEKDDLCPPGEVMTNDGCKPRAIEDKVGKQGFTDNKSVAGNGVESVKTWGYGEGTTQEINYGPLISSVNSWEQTSIVRAMDKLSTITDNLTRPGSAPVFEFSIGGKPLIINLAYLDPVVSSLRALLAIFLYFSLIMVVIRQWRML